MPICNGHVYIWECSESVLCDFLCSETEGVNLIFILQDDNNCVVFYRYVS
jgi:hypothetical protein